MGARYSNSLRPEMIEDLQRETALTSEQIRRLYQGYQNICCESKTWPKSFNMNDLTALYSDIECASPERFVRLLFEVMDSDGNGTIDFREYAVTSEMYFVRGEREKLCWLFSLYDRNKSGYILHEDLKEIVEALMDVIPDGTFDETLTVEAITNEILSAVDTNGDKRISKEEFIIGASSCKTLRHLLKETLKVARKPYAFCRTDRKQYRERSRSRTSTISSLASMGI